MEFYIWPVAQDFQFFSNRVCDILSFPDIYYLSIMAQMCRGLIINWFHLLCRSPKPLKSWKWNAGSSLVPQCSRLGRRDPGRELRQPPLGHSPFAPALWCKEDELRPSLAIRLDDLCCHSLYSVENAFKYNTQAVRKSYQSKRNNVQRKRYTMEQRR